MSSIKKIRKLISQDPAAPGAQALMRLAQALETGAAFPLTDLYALDYDTFGMAIDLVRDWRLHRYFTQKGKLLDVAEQAADIRH